MWAATVAVVLVAASGPWIEPSRGEVFVEQGDSDRPPGPERKVHGAARLGAYFGSVVEDPMAFVEPGVDLDLRAVAPVQISLGTAFRLRMVDRSPQQSGVLRRRDWDEVGDYFSVIQRVQYADSDAAGDTGVWSVDLRAGRLGRMQLGHGSIVRGYNNGLDIDRPRAGLDTVARVDGVLLDQPASVEGAVVIGDIAMSQILGARVGGRWAGAGLGITAVGDPTAPHEISRDATDPTALLAARRGQLATTGRRGVAALGLDLSYEATDGWRYVVLPYLDLNWLPNLGQGAHLGLDAEGAVGRRRQVHLGGVVEMTGGSSGYDPAYFDVFYLGQRWQAPTAGTPSSRPTGLGSERVPKYAWVQDQDLGGVGAYGALRFAHDDGGFVETGYQYRPGPLGHTWDLRGGVELRRVQISLLVAHRGRQHGFEFTPAGSVARLDVNVVALRYLEVGGSVGWLHAIRPDAPGQTTAVGSTALVTGAGLLRFGITGRIPW
jgi:hypothetical protein